MNPCIPTRGTKVPAGPDWLHEIKHDGYRLIVQREGKRVRLFTRNGYDWRDRYPPITEAALRNRNTSFVIDGEAVLLGVNGISDFDGLHSRKHDDEVQFYAFDCLVSDGENIRRLPLSMRKANLSRLLARRVDGIFLSDFEQGEIGPDLYRHACLLGLEGLVSKHRERPYRAGRSPHWLKVKNPNHPAMSRVKEVWDDHMDGRGNRRARPTHTVMQIANTLHRSYSAIRGKAKELRNEGLLEAKNVSRSKSIKPDPQDFDKVKRDYCRKHHITIAQLCARLDEGDDQLAAELYRLAHAAKLTRLRPRKEDNRAGCPGWRWPP